MSGTPRAAKVPQVSPEDIKAVRRRYRLSRAEFADELGVTGRVVGMWEAGDRMPWYLGAILHWFECSRAADRS